ncbi:hypothetical protein POM88_032860 [Heracleum sosnowskyi]|uniref:Cullin N-terminal domain-containing protein n=1 Tax=Heracleum sosnowskyi TaxID=360622 RepID=A0AAD8ML07_9APIA|nr:hypothetical protein POM88_032860 [Heracleum sosnowskyi]
MATIHFIKQIDEDLQGGNIDHEVIKGVLDMVVDFGLNFYENDFEIHMLKKTKSFFSTHASKWKSEDSRIGYLKKEITCALLPTDENQLKHFYDPCNDPLLKDIKLEDVEWMYRLLNDVPRGLHFLSCVLKEHIIVEVTPSLKKAEDMGNNNEAICHIGRPKSKREPLYDRKKLSRTLLDRGGGDVTHDENFLNMLEEQLGPLYTSQMKKMVDDVTSAEAAHQSFNDYLSRNPNVDPGLDLRVTMLNSNIPHWTTQKQTEPLYDRHSPILSVKLLPNRSRLMVRVFSIDCFLGSPFQFRMPPRRRRRLNGVVEKIK